MNSGIFRLWEKRNCEVFRVILSLFNFDIEWKNGLRILQNVPICFLTFSWKNWIFHNINAIIILMILLSYPKYFLNDHSVYKIWWCYACEFMTIKDSRNFSWHSFVKAVIIIEIIYSDILSIIEAYFYIVQIKNKKINKYKIITFSFFSSLSWHSLQFGMEILNLQFLPILLIDCWKVTWGILFILKFLKFTSILNQNCIAF